MDAECKVAKESSIMSAFARLDNEIANLDTQVEKLFSSIGSVLEQQKQPETATEEPSRPDTCEVVANINSLDRKVSRIRENIQSITSRIQL